MSFGETFKGPPLDPPPSDILPEDLCVCGAEAWIHPTADCTWFRYDNTDAEEDAADREIDL